MITTMSWADQQTIIWVGLYLTYASWIVLAILVARHLIRKDYTRFKITLLYALNSLSFLVAYGMIIRLAMIVITPLADTRDHSIDIIWNEANRYFADHLQFTATTLLVSVVFNLLYMRYLVRRSLFRHTVILFIVDAFVLFAGLFLSVGSYYMGMLQEIDRYFLGR